MEIDEIKRRLKNPKRDTLSAGIVYAISFIIPNPLLFNEPFLSYGIPTPIFVAEINFQSLGAIPSDPSYTVFWVGLIVNTIFWTVLGATTVYTYRKFIRGDKQ